MQAEPKERKAAIEKMRQESASVTDDELIAREEKARIGRHVTATILLNCELVIDIL